ncbi:hypothetical protein Prum_070660 [Phytohabitans rumicis]|uniref:Peptidase S1 domain-containing protein n=2 Tax=Phytohabitans rumicis TaxID=1076125 RepID=A0A6V8LAP6_9ACTN|nr:hypothetical protein Prum_070660 [Phytohabitans rumicis]
MRHRWTSRIRTGGVVAVGVVLAVSATPARADLREGPTPTPNAWITSAEGVAESLWRSSAGDADFATIKIDPETRKVVVYRKGGAALSRYQSVPKPADVAVEYRTAPLSGTETNQLIHSIKAQTTTLAKQGIEVNAIWSSGSGPVTIQVQHMNSNARNLATRFGTYGPGTVTVEEGIVKATRADRDFDARPFVAGAHTISSAGVGECTSGFTGRSAGTGAGYMIVAWHCVRLADPRIWTTNKNGVSGGSYVGRATVLDMNHDIAYVRTADSVLPAIWDGPIGSPFLKNVTAMQKPNTSMTRICTSGAFSGARCYGTIYAEGWYYIGGYWSYLWVATSNNGTSIAARGDSGGPVFIPNGNNVTAVGMISAVEIDPNLPCTGDATQCGQLFYFTDVYTEAWLNHDINMTQSWP